MFRALALLIHSEKGSGVLVVVNLVKGFREGLSAVRLSDRLIDKLANVYLHCVLTSAPVRVFKVIQNISVVVPTQRSSPSYYLDTIEETGLRLHCLFFQLTFLIPNSN